MSAATVSKQLRKHPNYAYNLLQRPTFRAHFEGLAEEAKQRAVDTATRILASSGKALDTLLETLDSPVEESKLRVDVAQDLLDRAERIQPLSRRSGEASEGEYVSVGTLRAICGIIRELRLPQESGRLAIEQGEGVIEGVIEEVESGQPLLSV